MGQDASVNVITNNTFNGKVILVINGVVNDNITIANGQGSYSVKNLSAGNYTAYVGFNGNDTFKPDATSFKFEVKKYNPNLTVNVENIFVDQNATVNIAANSTFSGNVTVSVNGTKFTVKVSNGFGNYNVSGLAAGNYTVTVSFNGNDRFNSGKNSTTFIVNKYTLDLNVNVEDIYAGQDETINITTNSTPEMLLYQ